MTDIATAKALKAFETAGREAAEQLDLSGFGLRRLPPELSTARDLKLLDLSGNRLRELPEGIGAFTCLEQLDLGGNRLDALPPEIGRLQRLRRLDASDNQLASLPAQLADCRLLEQVELGNNQLADVSALASLRGLTLLDLSRNLLAMAPALGCADTLATLDLAGNRLAELPGSIAEFSMLRRLDVSDNRLTRVAPLEGLGLVEVFLDGNLLAEPPLAVTALPTLRRFSASRNPFGVTPETEATPGTAEQTTALAAAMSELTVSERDPDALNAFPAELFFAFTVLVNGASAARVATELYFKRFNRYSVTLTLDDGAQLALHNLNRKAATSLLNRHVEAAGADRARLAFAPTDLGHVAAFSAELLARTGSIDVVPDKVDQPIVHFHQHIGDQYVMGDKINISGVSGIVNVKAELSNVVQTVNSSTADPAVKTQLTDLVTRLGSALAQLPPERAEEAEEAASTAQNLIKEAVKEKPNRARMTSMIAGFRTVTEKLGDVAPLVTEIVTLVNDIIGA